MKNLLYLKEKKDGEKKTPLSVSVPQSIAFRIKKLAKDNDISPSDIGEEAFRQFLEQLDDENTPQEAYQTEGV